METNAYINFSTNLRVLEKRLVTRAAFERAADAASPEEALRLLSQNSDYAFTSMPKPEDYEGLLKSELKRVFALSFKQSPDSAVPEILAAKYDFHNAKAALKEKYFKNRTAPPYIELSGVSLESIAECVEKSAELAVKMGLPKHLADAVTAAKDEYEKSQNPQTIDIVLDKAMFAHELRLAERVGSEFISKHIKQQIDFYNIKALLRCKNMQKGSAFLHSCLICGGLTDTALFISNYNKLSSALVPVFYYKYYGDAFKKGMDDFEKSGNFSRLERLLDDCLIEETKKSKYITFGPELVYSYLYSKENEIRQIRIVVTGKLNKMGAEALKERLRSSYV